jgi:4-hydroxy-tetrahydrodipicolinate reductase
MAKQKVYELAKELNKSNKEVMEVLGKHGIEVKSHLNAIEEDQAALVKKAAQVLGDRADIEIIEAHHNQKIDAPSGTANMLLDAVVEGLDREMIPEYDRHSRRQKRQKNEIGMHSIRGGTIVGEHEVMFAGKDEIVTLSHSARSKEVFAVGAVKAACFLIDKAPGMYDMTDLVNQ